MACSKWSFGWKFEGCILIFKIFLSVYPSWTTIGSAALHRHHWLNFCCLPKHFSPSLRSSLLPPSPPSTSFCSRPFRNGLKQRQQQQQQQKKKSRGAKAWAEANFSWTNLNLRKQKWSSCQADKELNWRISRQSTASSDHSIISNPFWWVMALNRSSWAMEGRRGGAEGEGRGGGEPLWRMIISCNYLQ